MATTLPVTLLESGSLSVVLRAASETPGELAMRRRLVAGRNLSAEHAAQASVRVAGPCMALGEAAGIGAALSLAQGDAVTAVSVSAIQAELRRLGAIVEPEWYGAMGR